MDIKLAVDAMEIASNADEIVLFSDDGAFRSLVEALQRQSVRLTIVSTIQSIPPMLADELLRQADAFIDFATLKPLIDREGGSKRRNSSLPPK